jgi:hypothetical protein
VRRAHQSAAARFETLRIFETAAVRPSMDSRPARSARGPSGRPR